ncbi:MAG: CHRD domain-containing protein [Verrucomicrobiales bacterium]|nr:CHRD domain-containing protein [Verrucomicrobiales bacterium]
MSSLTISSRRHSLWICLAVLFIAESSQARNFRVNQLPRPNGGKFDCLTCHTTTSGGGARNAFGVQVNEIVGGPQQVAFWSAALAALDSDGDGFSNGAELGDPEGDGTTVGAPATITNPGDPASNPLNNKMPTARLTSPAGATTITVEDQLTVVATAQDVEATGTITLVEFFAGTNKLGESAVSPYTLTTSLPAGTFSVFAKATDAQNGTGVSPAVTVTVTEAPLRFVASDASPNGVTLGWKGGGAGPFVIQRKSSLEEQIWQNSPAVSGLETVIPATENAAFFRIADLSKVTTIPFSVQLSGAAQRPDPVAGDASGFGLLRLEGSKLFFEIKASGLSGPITGAHIHGPASVNEANGVLVSLDANELGGAGKSGVFSGSVTLSTEVKTALVNGQTYINLHTAANPAGEIRGQIAPVAMSAALSGANQRPEPVSTPAVGSATALLIGDKLYLNITYSGLSGAPLAAHIHGPASPDGNADVLVDLMPLKAGDLGSSGAFGGSVNLTPAQIAAVADGSTYLNLHTAAHGSGEIRGQLTARVTALPLTAKATGAGEKPTAVNSPASGLGIYFLEGTNLTFNLSYQGFTNAPTAAHIHGSANSTNTAGVLIDFAPLAGGYGLSGGISGSINLATNQLAAVRDGRSYMNFHTPANPAGEIRGQLVPAVMKVSLNGASMRPSAITTAATSTGTLLLAYDRLHLAVGYDKLATTATSLQLHGRASTTTVVNPSLLDLSSLNGGSFGTFGGIAGSLTIEPKVAEALNDVVSYLIFRTTGRVNGEIRGQVTR